MCLHASHIWLYGQNKKSGRHSFLFLKVISPTLSSGFNSHSKLSSFTGKHPPKNSGYSQNDLDTDTLLLQIANQIHPVNFSYTQHISLSINRRTAWKFLLISSHVNPTHITSLLSFFFPIETSQNYTINCSYFFYTCIINIYYSFKEDMLTNEYHNMTYRTFHQQGQNSLLSFIYISLI